MSSFEPSTFMDATLSEPSVRRPPLPAGIDVVGTLGEPKPREWTKRDDPTKKGIAVDVTVEVDASTLSPEIQAVLGSYTGKIILRDGIMLDTTPSGAIDTAPGKNTRLRQYREALDMNKPGDTFSFRQMQGRQIRVKIKHEIYENEPQERIQAVARV